MLNSKLTDPLKFLSKIEENLKKLPDDLEQLKSICELAPLYHLSGISTYRTSFGNPSIIIPKGDTI